MDLLNPQSQPNHTYAVDETEILLGHDWWVRSTPHIAPERTCNEVTALVDGEEALEAMAEAIKQAEEYIYITDWALTATLRMTRKKEIQTKKVVCKKYDSLNEIALVNNTSVTEILLLNPDIYISTNTDIVTKVRASSLSSLDLLESYRLADKQATLIIPNEKEETLLNLLVNRIKEKPNLQVRVIIWDCFKKVVDTNDVAAQTLLEQAHKNIKVSRHRPNPFYTHHQKSMVVDGKLAFLGGVDLYTGRWDNKDHNLYADPTYWIDDHYNSTLTDTHDPRYVTELCADRDIRLPWHDVHCRIEGPSVYDVETNFVQRWNYQHEYLNLIKYDLLTVNKKYKPTFDASQCEPRKKKVQILRSVTAGDHATEEDIGGKTEHSIYNAYCNAISNAQHFIYIENQFFVSNYGLDNAGNEIAHRIAKRVITAIENNEPFKVVIVIPSHPEGSVYNYSTQGTMYFTRMTIGGKEKKDKQLRPLTRLELIKKLGYEALLFPASLYTVADSIDKVISNASAANKRGFKASMFNLIVDAIITKSANKLSEDAAWDELGNYVGIYCLRNYGVIPNSRGYGHTQGKLVHGPIYVHAKMMIVDDRIAIIGSANLNERSQLGTRDSEIAALIEDQETVTNQVGEKGHEEQHLVRKFAFDLRTRLWAEHLGLNHKNSRDMEDINNPFKGFDELAKVAKSNTKIYEDTFFDMPKDSVTTIDDQKNNMEQQNAIAEIWASTGQTGTIRDKLHSTIKGHLTKFPLDWLWESVENVFLAELNASSMIVGEADQDDSDQQQKESV